MSKLFIQHYWYSILLDRTVLNDKFKKKKLNFKCHTMHDFGVWNRSTLPHVIGKFLWLIHESEINMDFNKEEWALIRYSNARLKRPFPTLKGFV